MILIRFLGAGTLSFCFTGPIQLAHCMFYAGKPKGVARCPAISRERREMARSTLCAALRLVTVLNMHKLYWPSENKMAAYLLLRNGWVSQRIWWYLCLFYVRQYFNGKKIRRILKLYGLFPSQNEFLEQTGVCRDFFRHVTAKIPDGEKLVTRSVKRFSPSVKQFSK